ncbi:hypothetical protein C8J56DRAFT_806643, partial [Mycena floridula]
MGWTKDVSSVLSRHPEMKRPHRRRNVSRSEHKDHLNRKSWIGDSVVGNCDLPSAWREGRRETIEIFRKYSKLPSSDYDLLGILSDSTIDFLRPHGQNKYPGVETDPDRSLIELAPIDFPPISLLEDHSILDTPTSLDSLDSPQILLEELLPDEPEFIMAPGPGIRVEDYMADTKGKAVHKASVCRKIINKDFVAKSKNRSER